ncbi:hypothetical protein ACHQM5_021322 [Ranunculus cassubicifolius]
MTNTIYYDLYRDDTSESTNSSEVSQQLSIVDQQKQSSLSSVVGKAIAAFRFQRSGLHQEVTSNDERLQTPSLMGFSYKELKSATRNFRPDALLGQGAFGKVFKGWIDDKRPTATNPGRGMAVAVKILNVEGCQGHNEWLAEIKYLGELYHPNLIRLCGYCIEDEERGVSSSSSLLSWSIRMKIAVGAAKGLAFLHRPDINVIHRGVQCSNILLDSEYNAKLSDIGLARDGPSDGMSHVSTRVVGTVGYGAPEYIMTGHLTAKCDVYCFGVVLLQLFSGIGALGYNMRAGEYLLHWTKPHLNSGKSTHVLDSYLDGQYSWESAEELANLTLKCLENDPKMRPIMDEVVTVLERLQEL